MSDYADSDTPGRLLATARVRAGLTLAEVSARSRIPIAALEAIDADDHRGIAAPVYVRGFVRLYAREVGLDPQTVVALLDRASADHLVSLAREPSLPEPAALPPRHRSRALYSLAGVALIAGLLLVLFSVSSGPSGPSDRSLAADSDGAAPRVVPLPTEVVGGDSTDPAPEPVAPVEADKPR